jgi:hypothetical protein
VIRASSFNVLPIHGTTVGMYSLSAVCHLSSTQPPHSARSLGRCTQTLARGPGWQLGEGELGSWIIRFDGDDDDPLAAWSDVVRAIRNIADGHGLRPLLIDLRGTPRLAGATAELAAHLVCEFERRSLRVGIIVGPDLVHAARVHRLLDFHAPMLGRCCLTEDEGVDWIARGVPVAHPTPVVARPWTRSRPYFVAQR